MPNTEQATTRNMARQQNQLQQEQQQQVHDWELERQQLLEQIQSLSTRVNQLEESNNENAAGQPSGGSPSTGQTPGGVSGKRT